MPVFEEVTIVRDLSFFLDAGVVFYSIIFATIFLGRWIKDPRRSILDIRFAWVIFFVGMSLNTSSFIFADLYFTAEPIRINFTKAGYLSLTLALIAFFYSIERIMPYRTQHAFSISGIIIAALIALSPRATLEILAAIISGVTFIGIVLFFVYSRTNTSGDVRKDVNVLICGFTIGFFGFIARSDTVYNNIGEWVYIFGAILLVTGLGIFGQALISSPALEELDWRNQLVRMFVIESGGLLVYYHHFVEVVQTNEVLTAAGISGIQSLLQEVTNTEGGINTLSIGDYEILFSHGDTFSTVLVANKPYRVLSDKVEEFTITFHRVFGRTLQHYSGDIEIFNSADEILDEYF